MSDCRCILYGFIDLVIHSENIYRAPIKFLVLRRALKIRFRSSFLKTQSGVEKEWEQVATIYYGRTLIRKKHRMLRKRGVPNSIERIREALVDKTVSIFLNSVLHKWTRTGHSRQREGLGQNSRCVNKHRLLRKCSALTSGSLHSKGSVQVIHHCHSPRRRQGQINWWKRSSERPCVPWQRTWLSFSRPVLLTFGCSCSSRCHYEIQIVWLKQQELISHGSRGWKVQREGTDWPCSQWGLSPWLAADHLLRVSSHSRKTELWSLFLFS